MQVRLDELEQYQRANSLELKGAALEGDPYRVVKMFGRVLEAHVDLYEIDICHQILASKQKKILLNAFFQQTLEEAKRNSMKTSIPEFLGTPAPIRARIRANKQLLGAAIAGKRSAGMKYAWSTGGKLFARRNEDSR